MLLAEGLMGLAGINLKMTCTSFDPPVSVSKNLLITYGKHIYIYLYIYIYIYKRIICPIFLFFTFEYGAFFDLAFLVCMKPSPNVTLVLHKENKRQLFKAYRKISTIAPFTKKKKGLKKVYKYFKNILQVVLVLKVLQKLLT